jgi:DNA-binding SARP family transcriptional activator
MAEETKRRWRLLGPLRLLSRRGEIDPGAGKQACVLASLLLTPGRPVPVETLVDRLWEGSPPRSATAVAPYATRLRRLLEPVDGAGVLRHTRAGYLIECDPDLIDLHRLRRQVLLAGELGAAGDAEAAAGRYAATLRDWQPEALAGVPGGWAAGIRAVIGRERLAVVARLGELLLRLGRPAEAVEVLDPLVAEHPTAEPLAALLMSALAESGHPAAALRVYARARDAITEQLGARPAADLVELNARILRQGCGEVTSPGVPAQLPAEPADFTGRAAELERLDGAAGLAVICGPPGVGKSALAVRWGHRVRSRFPDGQLYLNLRGFDPRAALSPGDAARDLLSALVPAERIPPGLDARSALLRSELAGRRMLLVLDNARDAGQVRPLLPGVSGCAVVVTSRDRLLSMVGAFGAVPVVLAPLPPAQAASLLTRRLGAGRAARDAGSVRALAAATAGLPLAVVAVAARAGTRASLAPVVAELAASRLDGLRGPCAATDPRTVFSWSYAALSPGGARLFRLLGTLTAPDVSAAAASSLLGEPAGAAVDELSAASLLAERRPNRYALPGLLRDYAATLVGGTEREAAHRRLFEHYLHTARAAARLLDPLGEAPGLGPVADGVFPERIAGRAAAVAWFAAEHRNLMAAQAAGPARDACPAPV